VLGQEYVLKGWGTVAYWVKGMADYVKDMGKDYIQNIAETLNYLATLCPEGKVFVQLMYDVAVLAGLQALVGSIDSMLGTVSGRPAGCDFEKELNQVEYLISSGVSDISLSKLGAETGRSPDAEKLGLKAVELANEIGRLESVVAYKVVNCLATAFSTVQALERALAERALAVAQARQTQNQNQPPSQPAPTAKATGTD
jgi:hypothetical protein